MNTLHLKYVISIAENGSINKAAEELHVAQPNLSRVVKEMEADLGIQFFRRSSKGMMLTPDGELFVNQARKIQEQIDESRLVSLIHPSAVIGSHVEIGLGTVVMAGAVINYGSRIGKGCIVNTCASVDHDCVIGDYVHVAVGSHVCGIVSIGSGTWLGAGSTVSNNLNICDNCMVGAGAVVIRDISEAGTYIGVPAQKLCCVGE